MEGQRMSEEREIVREKKEEMKWDIEVTNGEVQRRKCSIIIQPYIYRIPLSALSGFPSFCSLSSSPPVVSSSPLSLAG